MMASFCKASELAFASAIAADLALSALYHRMHVAISVLVVQEIRHCSAL